MDDNHFCCTLPQETSAPSGWEQPSFFFLFMSAQATDKYNVMDDREDRKTVYQAATQQALRHSVIIVDID